MKRFLPLVVAVLAGGVAALAVNLLLADYAATGNDPVGKLSPRAVLTAQGEPRTETGARTQPAQTTTGPAPTTTTSPTTTDDDDDDGDDDRGRGRGRGRSGGDGSEDDD